MAGKSTTRVRRRPALAHWVAPHSNHAPPAVGRMRGEIHRGPIGNSRPAARGKTGSIALARAKPEGLAERKAALVVARVIWAVASVVVGEVVGRIDLAPEQKAVRKECRVFSVEGRGKEGARGIHSTLIPRHSSLDTRPSGTLMQTN